MDRVLCVCLCLVVILVSVYVLNYCGRANASIEATAGPPEPTAEETTEPTVETTADTEPPTTPSTEPPVVLYDVPLSEDLQLYIIQLCDSYQVDPAIVMAMIYRESTFDPGCVGDGGNSLGLMQIQPKWHSERMARLGCADLFDPFQNVAVGIDYLAEHISRGKGIEWALMAYNGGATYANRLSAQGKISNYAKNVLASAEEIRN